MSFFDKYSEGTKFIPSKSAKKEDPEAKTRIMLAVFRGKIRDLAARTQDVGLLGINTHKLSEEDMYFFKKFEEGRLTLEEVEGQLKVLGNIKEAASSRNLLSYMKEKLKQSA